LINSVLCDLDMYLKYTPSGYLFISPEDDCQKIVDAMLATDYTGDFCLARDFSPEFISALMKAGFLVMSADVNREENEPLYLLLPKLHVERSVLFYENLHIKKSIRRFLNHYELKADTDFEYIIDRCIEKHGADWLTPQLTDSIKIIRKTCVNPPSAGLAPCKEPYPASFAVYRDGKLAAGEFGVICGRVYTSYSGFTEEDNAGTVQLILTIRYLEEHGFNLFDLGMPLDYKAEIGAVTINAARFVRIFRRKTPLNKGYKKLSGSSKENLRTKHTLVNSQIKL